MPTYTVQMRYEAVEEVEVVAATVRDAIRLAKNEFEGGDSMTLEIVETSASKPQVVATDGEEHEPIHS